MTLVDLLVLLLVAGVAGAVGQAIAGYSRGGCMVSIGLGFIGSILGVWLVRNLGLPLFLTIAVGGAEFPIVWAMLGAAIFVAIVNLLSGRPRL